MIKNLTPHAINLIVDKEQIVLEPEGVVPRVATIEHKLDDGEYPFVAVEIDYGEIVDLPEPEEGVILVVSKMCCDASPGRKDLWYPTRLLRDEKGRIVACGALARNTA